MAVGAQGVQTFFRWIINIIVYVIELRGIKLHTAVQSVLLYAQLWKYFSCVLQTYVLPFIAWAFLGSPAGHCRPGLLSEKPCITLRKRPYFQNEATYGNSGPVSPSYVDPENALAIPSSSACASL